MTTETMLDRRLRELMAELAAPGDQSAAIDNVISVTRALRPEPRWRALLKERPMRTNSIVIAGSPPLRFGLIFAVIALIGLLAATVVVGALVLRQPAVPPAYGPAGNGVLAYAESGDIVTTDASGANITDITTGPALDSRPVFSRDGTQIAFLRKETGTTKLVVANADGTELQTVSPALYDQVDAIDWSPDGQRLVVLGDLLLDPRDTMSILVLAADGTGSREPIDLGDISPNRWAAWRPPAGEEIIFRANPTRGDPAAALYAIAPEGGQVRPLMEPATPEPIDASTVWEPELSPDGRSATFYTWGQNEAGDVNAWGRVLDLETGDARIASAWGGSASPITPDGQFVVGVGSRLEIEPLDGSTSSRTFGPAIETAGVHVAISPDGTTVLVTESSGARTLVDIETGAPTPLDASSEDRFSWQRVALP